MPALTPADRQALLGPTGQACPRCGSGRVRHYCRSCDEFFFSCHCPDVGTSTHLAHRVYLWTPSAIIARPDFD